MSGSYTQWADLPTSQENKRRSVDTFAEKEEASADKEQTAQLSSIQRAVEQERHRIAEDLHDSVAQDIALALHKLEYVQHLLEQSQLYQAFQEVTHVSRILENGLHDLRSSIDALLPQHYDKQPALASLMTLILEYQQDHPELQLDYRVEPYNLLMYIPPELEVPILRFVQQALNNIWQHARATHAVISLILISNILTVEVSDNGNGFAPQYEGGRTEETKLLPSNDETPTQFGLRIMRERIEQASGTWHIKTQPGGGTSVYATFPLQIP